MSSEQVNTSLTAPNDRNENNTYTPVDRDPLTLEELRPAMEDLNIDSFVKKYPSTEKAFADPAIMDQKYCLVSFVPSVTAQPDKDGIYGMIKVRGSYNTVDECTQRAEHLIKNIDSYHKVYTAYVGKPFPATTSSDYSAESSEIDMKKKMTKVLSEDIKQQKMQEKKEMDDMKRREEELIAETEKGEEDPYERYITMRVKKAQLVWTYVETQKKMEEMKQSILRTRTEIEELDTEHPEFIETYREKYMSARQEAGIKEDDDNSFLQFLGDDTEANLGF